MNSLLKFSWLFVIFKAVSTIQTNI